MGVAISFSPRNGVNVEERVLKISLLSNN